MQIYAVGVTTEVVEQELNDISGIVNPSTGAVTQAKDQSYFMAADFDTLSTVVESIVSVTCVAPGMHKLINYSNRQYFPQ